MAEERWSEDLETIWTYKGEKYRVNLHFAMVDGRLECVGFEVGQRPDVRMEYGSRGLPLKKITSSLIRDIPLASLVDQYIKDVHLQERMEMDAGATNYLPEFEEWKQRAKEVLKGLEAAKETKKGGRPGHPPEHYAEVAEIYARAYKERRSPLVAIQDHFSISKSTAAKWVSRCRELGLLPPTERGKPNA